MFLVPSAIEADTIILALGVTPRRSLVEEFEAAFKEVRVIGDAARGGRIVEAVEDGFGKAFVFFKYADDGCSLSIFIWKRYTE